jgi:hypothetical protein
MHGTLGHATLVVCALGLVPWALQGLAPSRASTPFAAEIARLSEPEGAFDTDNLISNERSYLEVIPALVSGGVSGGAYLGVGPDQNFSYIARIRPGVAYIIDIRRDNLLLHLLFKALFAHAPNRVTYLSLLTGRAPPATSTPGVAWEDATLEKILGYVDDTPRPSLDAVNALRADLDTTIRAFGVPLSPADLATLGRFHYAFIDRGLELQFNSHGRPPRPIYPTLRDLVTATDRGGRTWHYLASENDFQFVRRLQARDLVIPVVGDVSGPYAMRAISRRLAERGERVSAFYISNVESYLYRDGAYRRFTANVSLLPRDAWSVMIRSVFGGAASASAVQPMNDMLAASR